MKRKLYEIIIDKLRQKRWESDNHAAIANVASKDREIWDGRIKEKDVGILEKRSLIETPHPKQWLSQLIFHVFTLLCDKIQHWKSANYMNKNPKTNFITDLPKKRYKTKMGEERLHIVTPLLESPELSR